MRGRDESSGSLFNYVDLEARVLPGHPLRAICGLTNAALGKMPQGITVSSLSSIPG